MNINTTSTLYQGFFVDISPDPPDKGDHEIYAINLVGKQGLVHGPGSETSVHDLDVIPTNLLYLLADPILPDGLINDLVGVPGLLTHLIEYGGRREHHSYQDAHLECHTDHTINERPPVVLNGLVDDLLDDLFELRLITNVVVFFTHVFVALYGLLFAR